MAIPVARFTCGQAVVPQLPDRPHLRAAERMVLSGGLLGRRTAAMAISPFSPDEVASATKSGT